MLKLGIIICIMNLFLFLRIFLDIELTELFSFLNLNIDYVYVPLGIFVFMLLLLIPFGIWYFKTYNKNWKQHIGFWFVILWLLVSFYFTYQSLLIWTYIESQWKYAYPIVLWIVLIIYILLRILYLFYKQFVSFIRWGDFFKAGPALFVLLWLLYLYWFLVHYVFKTIL